MLFQEPAESSTTTHSKCPRKKRQVNKEANLFSTSISLAGFCMISLLSEGGLQGTKLSWTMFPILKMIFFWKKRISWSVKHCIYICTFCIRHTICTNWRINSFPWNQLFLELRCQKWKRHFFVDFFFVKMMQFVRKLQKIPWIPWNQRFSLTKRIFRQINSLVIYIVKSLLSRNFWLKCERMNFRSTRRNRNFT